MEQRTDIKLAVKLKKWRLRHKFRIKSKQQILRKAKSVESICGLYFLILNNEIVYIGQSSNVFARVHNHSHNKSKPFDAFSWLRCDKNDLNELETAYIAVFEPIYNGRIPQTQQFSTPVPFKIFWRNA